MVLSKKSNKGTIRIIIMKVYVERNTDFGEHMAS